MRNKNRLIPDFIDDKEFDGVKYKNNKEVNFDEKELQEKLNSDFQYIEGHDTLTVSFNEKELLKKRFS